MKKLFIFLLVIFSAVSIANAQQFKTHAVKEGETLESIAAKYEVSKSDIIRLNPEVRRGVRPNTILIIRLNAKKTIINKTEDQKSTISDTIAKAKKPKVTIKQEVSFIWHKVRRKETLYRISKKYDVTVDDIKKYNKELYGRELKKGERIRIPQFPEPPPIEFGPDSIPVGLEKYTVKPKEGKWRIAYENGITIDELEKLNPEIGESLIEGQELFIPKKATLEQPKVNDSLYNYYTVKPKEGFYRLKVKLGLTQEELEALNPGLDTLGLKANMVLRIDKQVDGNFNVKEGLLVENFSLFDSINANNIPEVTIILPFKLNTIQVASDRIIKDKIERDKILNYALDFYSGALLALDTVKQLGISANVRVMDSEMDEQAVARLFYDTNFENTDAVIGPLLPKTFNVVAEKLSEKNIPIFALVGSNDFKQGSNVFLSYPNSESMYVKMTQYIAKSKDSVNLIVISDKKNEAVRDRLKLRFPDIKTLEPHEDKFIRIEDINPLMVKNQTNWILVETQDVSLIANITSVLNSALTEEFKIRMLTTNKSNAFEDVNISNAYLSNLNFYFPSVNENISSNSRFVKAYRKKFETLPSKFAVRGYDLMLDVLLKLAYKKNIFEASLKVGETRYVENKFNYERNWSGTYANTSVHILYYEDLEVKKVPETTLYTME
ncbi:amino acid ABC transporter substrate-binding protein [Ascidiimonas sp. W6]|uniref:amino acid ABC transporter substrate-binding protein n=1 Tax=Ascidiimonas meishanensis TaxID=3128903 RepID=UPI0030EE00E8